MTSIKDIMKSVSYGKPLVELMFVTMLIRLENQELTLNTYSHQHTMFVILSREKLVKVKWMDTDDSNKTQKIQYTLTDEFRNYCLMYLL